MVFAMNTASPILQEEEERQGRILDADYSKVDIRSMVDELDISTETKAKLTTALAKFAARLLALLAILSPKVLQASVAAHRCPVICL